MDEALKIAARAYAAGDWSACLSSLDGIDATDANHLDLAYLLGLVHTRLGNLDSALLYLEQVVTSSEELLRVCQCRLALALVYARTGRNRLAEYELGRLVASGFESAQTCAGLGYALWAQGRADEAARWYEKALDYDGQNANALNGLGYVLAASDRDLPRSLELCRRAVSLSSSNPAYLDSLAWACHKSGLGGESRSLITEALRLAPGEREILDHARELGVSPPAPGEPE